jgi:TPR repeat protein
MVRILLRSRSTFPTLSIRSYGKESNGNFALATSGAVALCLSLSRLKQNCYNESKESLLEEESRNFDQTLNYHQSLFDEYKEKWDWRNTNSRMPTVSWPLDIPNEEEIPMLTTERFYCQRQKAKTHDNNTEDLYCQRVQFRIASHLLLQPNPEIQKKGLALVKELAEANNPDGMCAYATCLNDGRSNLEPNPIRATSWWNRASDIHHHTQSTYEMGVAYYTGEGVAENEELAVQYFRRAADCGHAGAAYMLGDCLLDGVGVVRDRGEALEWLICAAELGHRGARSRVLAVLGKDDGEDYGEFTDSSRQTLKETEHCGTRRDGIEMQYSERPVLLERRYTIGGGSKNPVILARRLTIVEESRQSDSSTN